jgi:hypothetical protein
LPREAVAMVGIRMMSETGPGDDDGSEAGGSHGGGGDLCDDDGANDVDRIGRLRVGDARAPQLVRGSPDRVVDDEPRCSHPRGRAHSFGHADLVPR